MTTAAQAQPTEREAPRFQKALLMKEPSAEQRKLRRRTFVASTTDVDSHGDVVEQKWNLERYLKNPVVLWAHDRWGYPIGKAVSVGMVGDHLECEIEFAPESANPEAEKVWQLCEGGFVRAVSVSFWPNDVRWEKRDGEDVCVCSDNELFEISVLPIGSNPEALSKAMARAFADRANKTKETPMSTTISTEEHQTAITAKDKTISERDQKITALEKQLADERVEKTVVEKARDKAEEKVKTLEARVTSLETELVDKEVDALIPDRIDAADRDEWIALRKQSKTIFEKQVARLPNKQHTTEVSKSKSGTVDVGSKGRTGETATDTSDIESKLDAAAGSN